MPLTKRERINELRVIRESYVRAYGAMGELNSKECKEALAVVDNLIREAGGDNTDEMHPHALVGLPKAPHRPSTREQEAYESFGVTARIISKATYNEVDVVEGLRWIGVEMGGEEQFDMTPDEIRDQLKLAKKYIDMQKLWPRLSEDQRADVAIRFSKSVEKFEAKWNHKPSVDVVIVKLKQATKGDPFFDMYLAETVPEVPAKQGPSEGL